MQFEEGNARVIIDEFGALYPKPQINDSDFAARASCDPEKNTTPKKSFIVLIRLEDTSKENGHEDSALRVIPASHGDVHRLDKLERAYLRSIPSTPLHLQQGSIAVMNKCTYFQYTQANANVKNKPLLFFSYLQLVDAEVPPERKSEFTVQKLLKEKDEGKHEL